MSENKDLTPSEKMRTALGEDPRGSRKRQLLDILLGMITILLVMACCIFGIAAWWFRPLIQENPEATKLLTRQIVDIQIPEAFQPHGLVKWNLAFVMNLRGVYYQRYVGDGVLSLLEVNSQLSNEETIRNHIRKTLLEQAPGGTELVIDHSQTYREIMDVIGQQVPFTFEIARSGNGTFHLMEGVFTGKSGQVLLSIRVDDLHWRTEADFALADQGEKVDPVPVWVRKMIASIGQPESFEFAPTLEPTPAASPPTPVPSPTPAPVSPVPASAVPVSPTTSAPEAPSAGTFVGSGS